MVQRLLVASACLVATIAVGSYAKVQRTFLSVTGQAVPERLAERDHNCGLSCTAIAPEAPQPQTV